MGRKCMVVACQFSGKTKNHYIGYWGFMVPFKIMCVALAGAHIKIINDPLGRHRRGELLRCMNGRANPLMDRKVVGVVFFGMAAMVAKVTSATTGGCRVV